MLLSDAIRLRDAILAERRAEHASGANTVAFPTVAAEKAADVAPKPVVRPGFLDRLRAIACL